jgi:hypothetical protein
MRLTASAGALKHTPRSSKAFNCFQNNTHRAITFLCEELHHEG